MVLYGLWWFKIVEDGSVRFWLELWLVFRVLASFICCLIVLASSRLLGLLKIVVAAVG